MGDMIFDREYLGVVDILHADDDALLADAQMRELLYTLCACIEDT